MRILLITSEEWNDFVYSNGVLTNWFTGFDAEFAQIYSSPGLPNNKICHRYFQISDGEMAKSILTRQKSGKVIQMPSTEKELQKTHTNARRQGIYGLMKNISLHFNAPVVLLRDFIWTHGVYNTEALRQFISDFNPDVVFCPRKISPKIIRLERIVASMTNVPFIAFTGDDEAPKVTHCSFSLSCYRRWKLHKMFAKHVHLYSHYFMHSSDQADEYRREYRVETSTLFKCGEFPNEYKSKEIGNPIRMVYAGRLYCNRWKSLAEIGTALRVINRDSVKMVLDIYTQEQLTNEQKSALSESNFIYLKGSVTSVKLKQVYANADIALHVESLDQFYRMVTHFSFSTKIIDLMASTCAILAICWEKHAGYQYLKNNDAALCISDYDDILPLLQSICDNPLLISEYAEKAYNCGKQNHNRKKIQDQIRTVFEKAIANK